jgi:hypothetical protein
MKRLLAALLLVATPALADTVVMNNGTTIEGTVTEKDGKVVVKKKNGIEITLDRADIAKIEVGNSLRDEYAKKKADLVPGDPEPRYALAQWCKDKGLTGEQKEMLEEVLKLSPDHPAARRDLGYVKDGDQWITEDAYRKKLGYEKVNGKWIPAADAKRQKRQEEIKKLLVRFALAWPKKDKKADQAKAELDALVNDEPGVVGPMVEERLGEHDAGVREQLVELLGKVKAKSSAPKLITMVFEDEDRDVRLTAAKAAWALEDVAARTKIVQSLFASKKVIRDRAGDALGCVQDPLTIPYLIEALYLVTVQEVVKDDEPPISRGWNGIRAEGNFGGYYVQAGETQTETKVVFLYSKKVLAALKEMTGKDFDFSKHDWFQWWEKEGKAKFLKKDGDKGAAAPAK